MQIYQVGTYVGVFPYLKIIHQLSNICLFQKHLNKSDKKTILKGGTYVTDLYVYRTLTFLNIYLCQYSLQSLTQQAYYSFLCMNQLNMNFLYYICILYVKDDLEKNHPIDKSKTFPQCYAITSCWTKNIYYLPIYFCRKNTTRQKLLPTFLQVLLVIILG